MTYISYVLIMLTSCQCPTYYLSINSFNNLGSIISLFWPFYMYKYRPKNLVLQVLIMSTILGLRTTLTRFYIVHTTIGQFSPFPHSSVWLLFYNERVILLLLFLFGYSFTSVQPLNVPRRELFCVKRCIL